jgi:hypothetical protein
LLGSREGGGEGGGAERRTFIGIIIIRVHERNRSKFGLLFDLVSHCNTSIGKQYRGIMIVPIGKRTEVARQYLSRIENDYLVSSRFFVLAAWNEPVHEHKVRIVTLP